MVDIPSNMIGIKRTNNAYELAAWYTAADVFVNPTLEAAELKGRLEMVSVKDKRFVGGECLALFSKMLL